MLNYSSIRNLYKSTDTIQSNHLITAEWNMNKYSIIEKVGLYKNSAEEVEYDEDSLNILNGNNHILFDNNQIKKDPKSDYFSRLSSVFKPNRPDPGIVYIQKFNDIEYTKDYFNIRVSNLSTASPRFYPVSEDKPFDYFNSAKILGVQSLLPDLFNPGDPVPEDGIDFTEIIKGVTNNIGKIQHVNPFVVYEEDVLCNKIVIKVQNHISIPHSFSVDILVDGDWTPVYNVSGNPSFESDLNIISSPSDDFASGELSLYLQPNGSWSKNINRMNDFNQLTSNSPTQFKRIKGIRFRLRSMINTYARNTRMSSLELIEISPRLETDVTQYVESFSIDSSIGDSTSFGLPVGAVVSGAGNIILSNEEGQFLFASDLSQLKMLNEDVKFNFYQKVYVPADNETYNIPLGVLYSNQWNIGEDYSVSIGLEDGMKYLRQLSAPDFMISSYAALSSIIFMILDNVGVTGLEFKKSSDSIQNDKEDTIIKNFFCKKEQTVAEVFEQLAIATQCSMFYDASGKLNVLTKERLTENASITESTNVETYRNPDPANYVWYNNNWFNYSGDTNKLPSETVWTYNATYQFLVSEDHPPPPQEVRTDFWFVMDENVSPSDPERFYLSGSYTANVASLGEQKINPITDGDITYHFYGPRKDPLLSTLEDTKKKIYDQLSIDQFPLNSLAFANFDYGTSIMWQPSDDNTSVLGAANTIKDVYPYRLEDIFTSTYTAHNEEDAIKQMYRGETSASARQSLIIYLDRNEGFTIPDYEGYVMIDNEYIKYKGKLFYVASTSGNHGNKIIFSEEEFFQMKSNLAKGDSISFRGLVVEVKFKITNKAGNKYIYKVVGDGRGKFNSDVTRHYAVVEESDGVEPSERFKIMLGESANYNVPGNLEATTQFNFAEKLRYKSAKKFLGTLPKDTLDTYLGFLKISGPTGPKSDRDALESIISASGSQSILNRLNKINEQVDKDVPGDFDDFIFLEGEKRIYGQKINLPFAPNVISTRMRLYSPRKKVYQDQEIMSTNSSIAGIGFGINSDGEGYFLEVESVGSGKKTVANASYVKNLRFYKVSLKKNKDGKVVYTPNELLKAGVGGFTVFDTAVQVIKSDNTDLDPVFELEIRIRQYKNAMKYSIFYGDQKIGSYFEPIGEAIGINSENICMFVRNDSQAIFEYVMAAAKPFEEDPGKYFRGQKEFEKRFEKGIIPVNKSFLFKDEKNNALFYYNDFARLARQVREYEIRFTAPALSSALLDISNVNPQYLIKRYQPTAFGARLVVVNTSGGAVALGADRSLPLYIIGIALEELSTGTVTAKELYEQTEKDKLRQTERERNISIYGDQTFSLDSQYIQTLSQARSMMQWVLKYCSRQRIKLSMEIFENPLIELGDKVKIFDKSRGYNINNPNFGDKTFVVSSISRSVTPDGPSMTISLTEVGEL